MEVKDKIDEIEELESLKEPLFTISAKEWETFAQGKVWKELRAELLAWLMDTLNNLEAEEDVEMFRMLQGRARTLREVIGLPTQMITTLEQAEEV